MAPIFSFTAEEVWQSSPPFKGKEDSVFLSQMPKPNAKWVDGEMAQRWERFFTMRSVVMKALENARTAKFIGNSLAAKVVIEASTDQEKFLKSFCPLLERQIGMTLTQFPQ